MYEDHIEINPEADGGGAEECGGINLLCCLYDYDTNC